MPTAWTDAPSRDRLRVHAPCVSGRPRFSDGDSFQPKKAASAQTAPKMKRTSVALALGGTDGCGLFRRYLSDGQKASNSSIFAMSPDMEVMANAECPEVEDSNANMVAKMMVMVPAFGAIVAHMSS